jgi:predicted aspartyl protease
MTVPSTPFVPSAFTVRHAGKTNRLITEVEVFPAHTQGSPLPVGKKYKALYDTGATNSSVSPQVVADLNLPSIGAKKVGVGGGELETTSHLVNIALPNKVMFQMMPVAKIALQGDIDVLIGMDVLGVGDFAVTHHDGTTTFSFCCPSHRDIDFAKELSETQKKASGIPKVGRNDLCPCDSGKKYKRCHGFSTA